MASLLIDKKTSPPKPMSYYFSITSLDGRLVYDAIVKTINDFDDA